MDYTDFGINIPRQNCHILIHLQLLVSSWLGGDPSSFLLNFHSIPNGCFVPPPVEFPRISFTNHSVVLSLDDSMKFSQPANIILSPLYDSDIMPPVYTTFQRHVLRVTTVMVFLQAMVSWPTRSKYLYEANMPALKIVLFYSNISVNTVKIYLDCEPYCSYQTPTDYIRTIFLLGRPQQVHKDTFFRLPGTIIDAIVFFPVKLRWYTGIADDCEYYLSSRSDSIRICSHHLLLVKIFSKVHNISLNI